MTEWYCHFDPAEFAQAKQVQENLLKPETGMPLETVAVTPERTASGKTAKTGRNETAETDKTARRGAVLSFRAHEGVTKRKRA